MTDEATTDGQKAHGSAPLRFDRTERRILGVLIEKGYATPEHYPLTLNALVNGCNQKSNRDPVLALEPFEVEGALRALQVNGFVVARDREGGRTNRYAHELAEKLNRDRPHLAVIAELMLRGPQTTNELKTRIARMGVTVDRDQLQAQLRAEASGAAPQIELLEKRSGERYARWRHRFTPPDEASTAEVAVASSDARQQPAATPSTTPSPPAPSGDLAGRVQALEQRLRELESTVARLRDDRWHDVD